ncbi:hypothetical protein ACIRQF_27245 [Streptomyces sp. NPDC101191]
MTATRPSPGDGRPVRPRLTGAALVVDVTAAAVLLGVVVHGASETFAR